MVNEQKVADGAIQRSEVTGHAHRVEDGTGEVYEGPNGKTIRALAGGDMVVISHEEHKPIKLPSGIYATGIVVERDHIAEATRNVID